MTLKLRRGYITSEETLRDFVKLQQEIEREGRKAERERVKEELDFKRLMEKHDKELQIQQITHQQQMEMMHEKEKLKAAGVDERERQRVFKTWHSWQISIGKQEWPMQQT